MGEICKIDGKEFDSIKKLHGYISRTLKVKLSEYYPKFFPRTDLWDEEPIVYLSYGQYFSEFFNSRENMIDYFRNTYNAEASRTAVKMLNARGEYKNWKFAPCTVETRTSILPSPLMLETTGVNVDSVFSQLPWPSRFSYSGKPSVKLTPEDILIDSREQKPLVLDADTSFSKLDFGDYVCKNGFCDIFFERKSLIDFCGTLSQGFERFEKEIERAERAESTLIVLVEANLPDLSKVGESSATRHVKATPKFLGARMRELLQKYPNLQFVFSGCPRKTAATMLEIMSWGEEAKKHDIQYLLDLRKI